MNESLIPNARLYATPRQIELGDALGSGKDGIVFAAEHKNKPFGVAIKVLCNREGYMREKEAYLRLSKVKISSVLGFNIPELNGFDDSLLALEMTIVRRPFVLDFAGAYLDSRPEFSEEIWADWEIEKKEQFEDRWPTVLKIIAEFENLGIYLLDVTPNNIGFAGV